MNKSIEDELDLEQMFPELLYNDLMFLKASFY